MDSMAGQALSPIMVMPWMFTESCILLVLTAMNEAGPLLSVRTRPDVGETIAGLPSGGTEMLLQSQRNRNHYLLRIGPGTHKNRSVRRRRVHGRLNCGVVGLCGLAGSNYKSL